MQVGWDESTTGERQPRVSLWEIEPLTTFPMYPTPFPLRLKRPWPPGLPSFNGTIPGMKEDDMGMNSSLMWFRGDVSDRAMHCLNFQGIGMSPWMQPRVDPTSMLGMQNELYQAMAATAALQEMRPVDPSKQAAFSSFLQLQQCQNVPGSRPAPLMQNQMLQESQSQPTFLQSMPETQSHLQIPNHSHSLLLQQQLQHQNSFNNLQQSPQQQLNDHHQQVSVVMPVLSQFTSNCQPQSPSLQSLSSMQQPSFAESNGNHTTSPAAMSPLHSLVGSIPPDGTSHVLNVPRSSTLLSPTGWPPKRIAVDTVLSSVSPQSISPQVAHSSNPNTSPNSVSLPPFPGRECSIDQEGTGDPQNNLLFGVNIDSSSLIIQNGISNLRGVVSDSDSTTVPFGSSNYVNTTMTPSSCIDESGFLQSSENIGQANQPTRTFVKVSIFFSVEIILYCTYLSFFPLTCLVMFVRSFNRFTSRVLLVDH